MREDGVRSKDGGTWASLLAAAATEASLLLAAADADASDSADGGCSFDQSLIRSFVILSYYEFDDFLNHSFLARPPRPSMPTLSFELRPRSSRRATALRPLPTRRLRSEVAAATSATSARAGVGPSGLGEDDMREDGVRSEDGGTWASLLAAAATEASLLLAAAATDASDSADGGGRPVGGRPSKKN